MYVSLSMRKVDDGMYTMIENMSLPSMRGNAIHMEDWIDEERLFELVDSLFVVLPKFDCCPRTDGKTENVFGLGLYNQRWMCSCDKALVWSRNHFTPKWSSAAKPYTSSTSRKRELTPSAHTSRSYCTAYGAYFAFHFNELSVKLLSQRLWCAISLSLLSFIVRLCY